MFVYFIPKIINFVFDTKFITETYVLVTIFTISSDLLAKSQNNNIIYGLYSSNGHVDLIHVRNYTSIYFHFFCLLHLPFEHTKNGVLRRVR